MDADRDGFIGEADLKEIHMNLGRQPSAEELKKMLAECPGQLNFTAFLTLFGEKMHGMCYKCIIWHGKLKINLSISEITSNPFTSVYIYILYITSIYIYISQLVRRIHLDYFRSSL